MAGGSALLAGPHQDPRGAGDPGVAPFPDLNLRTYVRDRITGTPGFYCFSVDSSNLLAVAVAHAVYHLPYCLAEMRLEQRSEREFAFYSRRRFARAEVIFKARYRGLGPSHKTAEIAAGIVRVLLFGAAVPVQYQSRGAADSRQSAPCPWPLEEAQADIEHNDLAAAVGIELPDQEPVLHYSRRLAVYVWPAELVLPALAARPVRVAATPT